MRHRTKLSGIGCGNSFATVAELGPGDSLGIGLSAMLCGTTRYFALDARPFARASDNLRTLDELVALFAKRASIPDADEFPEISPTIASTSFPEAIFDGDQLNQAMRLTRLAAIRAALCGQQSDEVQISYAAPWNDASVVRPGSIDLAVSQAVLEHVEDVRGTYAALAEWLRPGGVMSHAIDFKSHSLTRDWYGHWTVSDAMWRVVRGRRAYLINRIAASEHVHEIERAGFEVLALERRLGPAAPRRKLATRFRELTDEDLSTTGIFVIAKKC